MGSGSTVGRVQVIDRSSRYLGDEAARHTTEQSRLTAGKTSAGMASTSCVQQRMFGRRPTGSRDFP
jgi:hypothetical protein